MERELAGRGGSVSEGTKRRFPKWWQALIILVSGIAIGLSSCAGFLGGFNINGRGNNGSLQLALAAGFVAGGLMALAGFVLLLVAVARGIVNSIALPPAAPGLAHALPVSGAPGAAFPESQPSREQRILRQLQIAIVVLVLLPATGVATSVLVLLNRPYALPSLLLIVVSYVLSQVPYGIALARTRRGADRLGIAIAFAASCVFFIEGCLPFFSRGRMFAVAVGIVSWPSLFLIGHAVVAVFAWRAGKLSPPEKGDLALIGASFLGVVAYLVVIRFLEAHFLPLLFR
jgi:hypothetical protein